MYRYRCPPCDAVGRPVPTRAEAEAQRAEHRRIAHGGLVPRGERIERVPSGTPDPDAMYVSGRRVAAACALLAAASLIARALGH